MSASPGSAHERGNQLLDSLSESAFAAIAPRLHRTQLQLKEVVGERNGLLDHVYFPCGAALSVLAYMADGAAVEVCTIGKEGFAGIEMLAGGDRWTETTICQIEGECLRMSAGYFKEAIAGDTPLRRITQRYMLVYLSLVSQSVACNRLHTVEARFARWVLMTQDRVGGNEFRLTHEFLASMLGVQRPSISLVASAFQQAGLIRYNRGQMMIVNRLGLKDASCECYETARTQFDLLLHAPRA